MKEKIMKIINSDPTLKQIYDNNGCFKSVVMPALDKCKTDDDILTHLINLFVAQSYLYDILLEDISKFGSNMLIEKIHADYEEFNNKSLNTIKDGENNG